ncbi:outer membrane beta-barrel protein [Melioribacter sp. OK-6-Me]|uniref:outer membrane beta-barrel protein n=1 Tax=Melioribacter sp. OK-6-Me TaxID=3423433 RepID=UPI003EDABFBE
MFRKVLLILIVCSSSIIYSQSFIRFGLKAGTTASTPKWTHDSNNDNGVRTKWGLDIGAFADIGIGERIALVPEIHFVQKGLRYDIPITTMQFPDGTGEFITERPNVNYISIPINVNYTFYKSVFEIYAVGGGRVDFAIDKKGEGFDFIYQQFKDIDYGVSVGLGFRTKELIGFGTGLEFRYSPNLTASYSKFGQEITNNSFEMLFVLYY